MSVQPNTSAHRAKANVEHSNELFELDLIYGVIIENSEIDRIPLIWFAALRALLDISFHLQFEIYLSPQNCSLV